MSVSLTFVCLWPLLAVQAPVQEPAEQETPPAQEPTTDPTQQPEVPEPEVTTAPPAPEPPPLSSTDQILEQQYFEVCDHNENGWISMTEAEVSLDFDQKDFGVMDTDTDGRVTREEFGERYRSLIERGVGFRPPVELREEPLIPRRNAEQLRNAYDQNGDRGIGERELEQLLDDYGREELPIEIVLEKLDRDQTTRIDGEELQLLSRLLFETNPLEPDEAEGAPPEGGAETSPVPTSIDDLFGVMEEREEGLHIAPRPPGIRGPVNHFRRLDIDNDGEVELSDLEWLQRPLHLSVRPSMVLAALDSDESGTLSREELLAALERQP